FKPPHSETQGACAFLQCHLLKSMIFGKILHFAYFEHFAVISLCSLRSLRLKFGCGSAALCSDFGKPLGICSPSVPMPVLSSTLLLQLALSAYAFGALGSLLALKWDKVANAIGFGSSTVAGACGVLAASLVLTSGSANETPSFELWPSLIPYIQLAVKLDALAAFFLLIVSLLALALSVYSFGYVSAFYGRKNVGVLACFYNSLLLATTLVFTAANAFFFLLVWEIMALTAYCLFSFDHVQTETRNTGVHY